MLLDIHELLRGDGVVGVYGDDESGYFAHLSDGTERAVTPAEVLAAKKRSHINAIRAEAQRHIEAVYPDWRQRSAALGLYPAEYVSTMQAAIASVIAASNTAEDAVDAATDIAAVEAVTVTWPVI